MAYLDSEIGNVRLVWREIADRVMVTVLIVLGLLAAGFVAALLGYGPADLQYRG